jgi:hypothetical protein
MARAYGSRAQMALAIETTYGTAPGSGYIQMPFASTSLGAEQPLLDNELLGYGRDPLAPALDAVTAGGDAVVPMDTIGIGHWLKLLFGAPTTTGSSPNYTHTYTSGAASLPSASIEVGMPEVPSFGMNKGAVANTFDVELRRSGLLTATVGLVTQGEAKAGTTGAGTPTGFTLQRFGSFNGAIKRDTVALANIVSGQLTYSNGVERVETIRADGLIDGADPTIASLRGNITTRFADTTLLDQAIAGTACVLEFSWTINANLSLVWTAHSVFLPRPKQPVTGPGGIEASFDWIAAKAASPARMCTVVLKNQTASYA